MFSGSPSGTYFMTGAHSAFAQLARDRVAHRLEHVVVLAAGHVGAVLLDPSGRDDADRLPGGDLVAHLHPGQLVDPDGVDALDGPRGGPHLFLAPLPLGELLRREVAPSLRLRGRCREQGEHQHAEYPFRRFHVVRSSRAGPSSPPLKSGGSGILNRTGVAVKRRWTARAFLAAQALSVPRPTSSSPSAVGTRPQGGSRTC